MLTYHTPKPNAGDVPRPVTIMLELGNVENLEAGRMTAMPNMVGLSFATLSCF